LDSNLGTMISAASETRSASHCPYPCTHVLYRWARSTSRKCPPTLSTSEPSPPYRSHEMGKEKCSHRRRGADGCNTAAKQRGGCLTALTVPYSRTHKVAGKKGVPHYVQAAAVRPACDCAPSATPPIVRSIGRKTTPTRNATAASRHLPPAASLSLEADRDRKKPRTLRHHKAVQRREQKDTRGR